MGADPSLSSISLVNVLGFPDFFNEFPYLVLGNMVALDCFRNDFVHREIDEPVLGDHDMKYLGKK